MEENENRLIEANDGEITRHHSMVINGCFSSLARRTNAHCEN